MDLSQLHPELLASWDSKKNSSFDIHNVRVKDKVWWICEKGHEWEAIVDSRKRGIGCPYCANQKLLKGYNDLATTNPEIAKEWNYEKNSLTPYEVFECSNKKARRKCEKGHEREAKISNRTSTLHLGCPYCSNKAILKGYNDLATTNPEIAKQWNYEKNSLTPYEVSEGSDKKVRRKCEKGHEWEARISSRTYEKNPMGCPYCSNQKILKGYNDLVTTNPKLAKQWNYEKNGNITPDMINEGSNKNFWWKCEKGHEWKARVESRNRGYGCPQCTKGLHISFPEKAVFYYILKIDKNIIENYKDERIGISELDIFMPDKKIAIEYDGNRWHSYKEKDILKNKICEDNHIKLYRIREYGCPKLNSTSIDFYVKSGDLTELQQAINSLTMQIFGISIDVNIERDRLNILKMMDLSYENSAENLPYQILKEWDFEKNKGLEPSAFSISSRRKVRWKCEKGHSYELSIYDRENRKGCPYCNNHKLLVGFNDLKFKNPKLANEWNYERNGDLKPDGVFGGSGKKVWWKCKKGHEREATIYDRNKGRGCPYCAGVRKIKKSPLDKEGFGEIGLHSH